MDHGCVFRYRGGVGLCFLGQRRKADLVETAEAIAAFGQIDVLVHNGGISQRGLVMETSMDVQRKVMEVDYFSYVALTQAVLPHFVQRNSGRFVVVSSVMGKIGTPLRSAYAAAKHALHGYFDCLRAEVASLGIGVTVLTPGWAPGVFMRMAPKLIPK